MNYVCSRPTEGEMYLLNLMWRILKGDELGRVSSRNILIFLLGIYDLKIEELIYPSNRQSSDWVPQQDISSIINKIEHDEEILRSSRHKFTIEK